MPFVDRSVGIGLDGFVRRPMRTTGGTEGRCSSGAGLRIRGRAGRSLDRAAAAWLAVALVSTLLSARSGEFLSAQTSVPSLDTVPAERLRVNPTAYTGIGAGYRQSARIVGSSVEEIGPPLVFVVSVDRGSPAERAGLRVEDIVEEINDVDIHSISALEQLRPGEAYIFRVRRGADELEVTLVPVPPPTTLPR